MAHWWRAVSYAVAPYAWTGYNYAQAAMDRHYRDKIKPRRGSVLYCDYLNGFAEHTGIYVGKGKIVNMSGDGHIKYTTPQGFIKGKTAPLDNIYVSCRYKRAVGTEAVAQLAEAVIGESVHYDFLSNNCHGFVIACLTVDDLKGKDSLDIPDLNVYTQKLRRKLHRHMDNPNRLYAVKITAKEILGANTWRVWDT